MKWLGFAVFALVVAWGASKIDWSPEKMDGCPFCNKEVLERQMIFKGEVASVIHTYKPAVPGHYLIIPNRHVERFEALEAEEIEAIGELVKKVHSGYQSDYVLIQKNGPHAGQSVPHVHVHILPRTADVGQLSFVLRFLVAPWLKPTQDFCH